MEYGLSYLFCFFFLSAIGFLVNIRCVFLT